MVPCRLTDLSLGLSFQKGSVAHDSFLNGRELVPYVSKSLLFSSPSADYTNNLIHASQPLICLLGVQRDISNVTQSIARLK